MKQQYEISKGPPQACSFFEALTVGNLDRRTVDFTLLDNDGRDMRITVVINGLERVRENDPSEWYFRGRLWGTSKITHVNGRYKIGYLEDREIRGEITVTEPETAPATVSA